VAKQDYDSLRRMARKRQTELLERQNRLELLEQRELKLQQDEAAWQRRCLETEELEAQIRRELESREQELAMESRELEQRRQELAMECLEKEYLRRQLSSRNKGPACRAKR
jgi:hypothetical protein